MNIWVGGKRVLKRKKELHVITTNQQSVEELIQIVVSIHPYVDVIHIREKAWPANKIVNTIQRLYQFNVPLEKIMINDRVDVAMVMNVRGAHLATHSLSVSLVKEYFSSLQVGCSVHSREEAIAAQRAGADYCIYGHIFPTVSKATLPPRGLNSLRSIIEKVDVPIIAIGGITEDNVTDVLQTGVKGVAVMSTIFLSENPLQAVRNIRNNMESD